MVEAVAPRNYYDYIWRKTLFLVHMPIVRPPVVPPPRSTMKYPLHRANFHADRSPQLY